jgi:hypothetical protein
MVVKFSEKELLSFLVKELDGFNDSEEMRYFGMYNYWVEYVIDLIRTDLADKSNELEEPIRFYKGEQKLMKVSSVSKLKTALYKTLESGPLGETGIKHVLPVRLCYRRKRNRC